MTTGVKRALGELKGQRNASNDTLDIFVGRVVSSMVTTYEMPFSGHRKIVNLLNDGRRFPMETNGASSSSLTSSLRRWPISDRI